MHLVAELLGVLLGLGPHLAGRLAGRREDVRRLLAEPHGHRGVIKLAAGSGVGLPRLELPT